MTTPPTLSVNNPWVKRLARLVTRRAERQAQGAFVVEGTKLVTAALRSGAEIEAVFGAVEAGDAVESLLGEATRAGLTVHRLGADALRRATDTVTPQRVLAVARSRAAPVAVATTADLVAVLVDLGDPGNAGTLLRTAEAAGAGAVVFAGRTVDPFNPKTVRASAGAVFTVPMVVADDPEALIGELAGGGHQCLAMCAAGGRPYDEVDLTAKTAILLGSEAHGLPDPVVRLADEQVTIPMSGPSESLNVAMAGTIICFEARRQRRRAEP